MANVTPIVYDAASKEHKPANVGDHISPAFVEVDNAQGNLLKNKVDAGLGVFASDFVSPTAGNLITTGTDGKLYAAAPASQEILSHEAGNYIRYGNDRGVFMDGNDVLSNGTANLLHISPVDGRVELTKDDLDAAGISGDVSREEFDGVKSDVNAVKSDVNAVKSELTGVKSDINGMRRDVDANTKDIADLKRDIQDVTVVSKDRNNVLVEGRDGGAYLSEDDIVQVVEDAGITKVEIKDLINIGTDPLLGQQGEKLVSGLSIQYTAATGRLDILGINGNSVANTTIPTAITLLKRVTLEDDPAGQPAGTYIHFQFELQDGSVSDVFLNVNKLAQFYSAGEGITIDQDGKVSVSKPFVEGVVDEKIAEALEEGGAIDDAIKAGAEDAITEALKKPGGAIADAIEDGVVDALDTDAVKDKIAEITEEAIKSGDVSIVSDDPDNMIKKGADGGAFLDKADIPAAGPSADAGNELTTGSDGKLFFKTVTDYGSLD